MSIKNNNTDSGSQRSEAQTTCLRNRMENIAAFGLILVCIALALPFASTFAPLWMQIGKWTLVSGTVVYLAARIAYARDPKESDRIRRLRRMETWAGFAFAAGAFFWFWNEAHLGPYAGPLAVLRDTIMFCLAGAMIQIIASWLIVWRRKKEQSSK
ncbi:MAG: hypothetical protein NC201_02030 [Prevotella sp.]|nr:hypothetical protein [Bacteroides sp.]MCM1366006.1 hypothetical protein [Prevotella sp.]MCM1436924.1 hypothetical protein [Prevotella sp.]